MPHLLEAADEAELEGPFSGLLERTLRTCEQRARTRPTAHCPCSEVGQLHEDHTTGELHSWYEMLAVATKLHKNKVFQRQMERFHGEPDASSRQAGQN